jgi:hypothetical protein
MAIRCSRACSRGWSGRSDDPVQALAGIPPRDGDVTRYYATVWAGLRANAQLVTLLGLICRLRCPIDLGWLQWSGTDLAVLEGRGRREHLFRSSPGSRLAAEAVPARATSHGRRSTPGVPLRPWCTGPITSSIRPSTSCSTPMTWSTGSRSRRRPRSSRRTSWPRPLSLLARPWPTRCSRRSRTTNLAGKCRPMCSWRGHVRQCAATATAARPRPCSTRRSPSTSGAARPSSPPSCSCVSAGGRQPLVALRFRHVVAVVRIRREVAIDKRAGR